MSVEISESNPNRCGYCARRSQTVGDWCSVYTFEPQSICMAHSSSFERSRAIRMKHGEIIMKRIPVVAIGERPKTLVSDYDLSSPKRHSYTDHD